MAHSHALQQATNYGAAFGGMMTVFRIDPVAGCTDELRSAMSTCGPSHDAHPSSTHRVTGNPSRTARWPAT